MAGGASNEDEGSITGINVTPFVDIALVLLIIFMVTAKYVSSPRAIPIDLPRASPQNSNVVNAAIAVSIDAAGALTVDARPMTEPALIAYLRERHRENANVRAIISAGDAVPHGRVVHAIDLVREAGVTKFAIQGGSP